MIKQNGLGYNILSDEMNSKIFGSIPEYPPKDTDFNKIKDEMRTFNVDFPIKNSKSSEVSDFKVPKLEGDSISEHFEKISQNLSEPFLTKIKEFIDSEVCFPPDLLKIPLHPSNFKPFWNKISFNGDISSVESPLEDVLVFDCETFVQGSDFGHPIIGSVFTTEAYYLWLHPHFLNPGGTYEPMFINIGQNKIVIAHNAAFDHARVKESYQIHDSNIWIDTMSMHINVSGLASGQRFWFAQNTKDPSSTKFQPKWAQQGSLNNLVDCYNFHCLPLTRLNKADKEDRNIFVTSESLSEIYRDFETLIVYALSDVHYTSQLFYNLFPKYHQANPSLTTLLGHTTLMRSFLPLHDDWDSWYERCEYLWEASLEKQTSLLSELALEVLEAFKNDEIDIESDPWLSQLDWEVNSKLTKKGKPASKWYGHPQWVRDIAKIGPDGSLVINKITTKQRISHLLLRLKWDNNPIKYSKSLGWGFFNSQTQKFERIPHPKEQDANVGNIITKDYLSEFESGIISSDLPQSQELLNLSISVSYWTSVRSRVKEVVYDTTQGFKAHVPEVVPHNTSTNRAGCNLWFTVPGVKPTKIGSEIKTMARAPKGWKFVQADYDQEESMIASIFADSYHKIAGSSAFSFSILAGNKADGTDMHSVTAKTIGIDRSTAKNINYALLYGSGPTTVANTIRKGNKSISMDEAKAMARKLITSKKGRRLNRNDKYLYGGSDSYAYNEMTRVASLPSPRNPLSGSKMSTAFRPEVVNDDFWTMRTNWVISVN